MAVYFLKFLVKVKKIFIMLEVLLISLACVYICTFTIVLDLGNIKNNFCKSSYLFFFLYPGGSGLLLNLLFSD